MVFLSGCSVVDLLAGFDSPRIESLVLVDGATGRRLVAIEDGDSIDLTAFRAEKVALEAIVIGEGVAEVVFGFDTVKRYRAETKPPYALAGDRFGKYNSWTPRIGVHTVTVEIKTNEAAATPRPEILRVTFTVTGTVARAATPRTIGRANISSPSDTIDVEAPAPDEASESRQATPVPEDSERRTLRVNCGGPSFLELSGAQRSSDEGMTAAAAYGDTKSSEDVTGNLIYLSGRSSGAGPLSYRIPVSDGTYGLTLHFMEQYVRGDGKRVFDVVAEGRRILEGVDVYARVGLYKPLTIEVSEVSVRDGALDLEFIPHRGLAMISAIDIRPR